MTLNLNIPTIQPNLTPSITVIGVGGAGGNAVNNMIQANLEGVDFLIANTDSQAIQGSLCDRCIQLGRSVTQGLGSGSRPDVGRAAAEEALGDILTELEGSNMVFITAGMGGGTGTGGAPVIARAAREAGILTVGVVTKPFHFEGVHRMRIAEAGITELTQYVDTLIVIPNQNLFRIANEKTTFADAFKMADDVLHSGVRGVTDLMVMPGLINLDFADIRSVMTEMGKAMMGTGEAEGENRSLAAAEAAISNPLLDDVSMRGARGVLINITGGPDLTLFEVDETANRIRDEVDPEANIIFGSTFDEHLQGRMRVSVVATGIDVDEAVAPRPVTLSLVSNQAERAAGNTGASELAAEAMATGATEAEALDQVPTTAEVPSMNVAAQAAAGGGAPNSLFAYSQAAVHGVAAQAIEAQPPAPEARMTGAAVGVAVGVAAQSAAVAVAEPEPQADPIEQAVAQPVASQQDGRFIAPPPVEAAPRPTPQPRGEVRMRPDPFAAAAIENGSRAPRGPETAPGGGTDRRRSSSLLAKMTGGAARALNAAKQGGEQRPPTPKAAAPSRPEPQTGGLSRPQSEPSLRASAGPVASNPVGPSSQPGLAGLDTAGQGSSTQLDEDLLDIPAFLRRQAN